MDATSTKIKPRTAPRDITDVLITLCVFMPLLFVPVFILPSAIVYLLTYSFLWAFAIYVFIYLCWIAFTVWAVRLSHSGIHFTRLLGHPRFLRWEDITEVAEAPRRELVIHGWLSPRFPTREMTPCLSALHHFRIRWRDGWCYYPPADTETFKRLIDEFRTKRVG
jgi:hypothetical protein